MSTPLPWSEDIAETILAAHAGREGGLLPILHDLQAAFGCVPEEAVAPIARALNLTRADVHGVISFYHDFRRAPPGRHVLKLCRAEACQAMGGAGIAEQFCRGRGVGWGATTPDGALTVERVFCLGLCATAPAALLDGEPFGRLTLARLENAVNQALGEAAP